MKSKYVLSAVLAALALGSCAIQEQTVTMRNDLRTGTDESPYRSIAPVVVCDDCG